MAKKKEMTMAEKLAEDERIEREAEAEREAAGIKPKNFITSLKASRKSARGSFSIAQGTWNQFTAKCESMGISYSSCVNVLINKFLNGDIQL